MKPMNPLTSSYDKDNLKKDRIQIQDFHQEIIQATNRALRKAYLDYLDSNKFNNEEMNLLDNFVTYLEGYKVN